MQRSAILKLMHQVLERQGLAVPSGEHVELRELGFRSLDFSELALRVESVLGRELNFDASRLRNIRTVSDVLDFFQHASIG